MIVIALLVCAYLAVVLGCQRSLMYPRAVLAAGGWGAPLPSEVERWRLESGGEALFLPPLTGTSGPSPAVIFAHGNGELAELWLDAFEEVRGWGMAVVLAEYPGYGGASGRPTQRSISATMAEAYDRLVSTPGIDADRIVGYGRSLGGGAICQLARQRDLAALVLESTFTSIRPLARRLGVPGFLVLDPFENLSVVSKYRKPILFLHGERDEIIPPSNAEKLHAAAADSALGWLPCGHNDCPRPWRPIRRFLLQNALLAS